MKACKEFKVFPLSIDVCDTCGQLSSAHVGPQDGTPAREAIWRTLLKLGGINSYYGGTLDFPRTIELRLHMGIVVSEQDLRMVNRGLRKPFTRPATPCQIDWRQTDDPAETTVSKFTDSFNDPDEKEAFGGRLTCRCKKYRMEEVVTEEYTLGQLIWHTVRDGE